MQASASCRAAVRARASRPGIRRHQDGHLDLDLSGDSIGGLFECGGEHGKPSFTFASTGKTAKATLDFACTGKILKGHSIPLEYSGKGDIEAEDCNPAH